MDERARAAAAEVVKRKVNRALGQLREAQRELAVLAASDTTVAGVLRVHDADTAEAVGSLITDARAIHGTVDVVILAPPRRGQ